jgi:hypothetical protein
MLTHKGHPSVAIDIIWAMTFNQLAYLPLIEKGKRKTKMANEITVA